MKRKLAPVFIEACNVGKIIGGFQRHDVDPSSAFWAPPTIGGISLPSGGGVEPGETVVMSDSAGPVERLNSKSTLSGNSSAFEVEVAGFFGLGTFSPPRWSEKSNSISIEDSSSVSLAEDIVVHAVAELALLSEELDEWPRPRDNE